MPRLSNQDYLRNHAKLRADRADDDTTFILLTPGEQWDLYLAEQQGYQSLSAEVALQYVVHRSLGYADPSGGLRIAEPVSVECQDALDLLIGELVRSLRHTSPLQPDMRGAFVDAVLPGNLPHTHPSFVVRRDPRVHGGAEPLRCRLPHRGGRIRPQNAPCGRLSP